MNWSLVDKLAGTAKPYLYMPRQAPSCDINQLDSSGGIEFGEAPPRLEVSNRNIRAHRLLKVWTRAVLGLLAVDSVLEYRLKTSLIYPGL
jgi:hypothetical protein